MSQVFVYKARNLSGKMLTGRIEAENQALAVVRLRERNYFVFEIKLSSSSFLDMEKVLRSKIKIKDMVIFCRQFSTMLQAGIPLLECLNTLALQTGNRRLRKIILEVVSEIKKGRSLAESFNRYKDKLPEIFVSMLASGELSGKLDQALGRLATGFEKDHEMREKIKSAMAYPFMVAVFAVAAISALFVFVVPVFVDIFSQMGARLPVYTRILICASEIIKRYWYAAPLVAAIMIIIFRKTTATEKGKTIIDSLLLRLPVAGILATKTITARFARTLASLLRSGVPLIQSLEIVEKVAGNSLVAKEIYQTRELVREGGKMTAVLKKSKFFQPMAVYMISVGEESGSLDTFLEKLAVYYDQEAETIVNRLSSMIEPLMIAGVGILVGFIALSIYMPLFSMAEVLQNGGQMP